MRDALRVAVLYLQSINDMTHSKAEWIAAMGGPNVQCGQHGITVQQLADCMEMLIINLTTGGIRTYPPQFNRDMFWQQLTNSAEGKPCSWDWTN